MPFAYMIVPGATGDVHWLCVVNCLLIVTQRGGGVGGSGGWEYRVITTTLNLTRLCFSLSVAHVTVEGESGGGGGGSGCRSAGCGGT